MRQHQDETIQEFISRLHGKADRCQFTAEELDERLIEAVIVSTPFENFRRHHQRHWQGQEIQGYPVIPGLHASPEPQSRSC